MLLTERLGFWSGTHWSEFLIVPFFGPVYPGVKSLSLIFFRINNTSWAVWGLKEQICDYHLAQSIKADCCHWYLLLFLENKATHQYTRLGTRYIIKYYKCASSFFFPPPSPHSMTLKEHPHFSEMIQPVLFTRPLESPASSQPSKWIKNLEFPLFLHPRDQRVQARAGERGKNARWRSQVLSWQKNNCGSC